MACEITLRPRQTKAERKAEVRKAVKGLDQALSMRAVKAKVGPQGAIAFEGWNNDARDGVSDACAYRILMSEGSAMAKLAIAQAEQMAGRTVDKLVIGQGVHSHDGGRTWNKGH